MANLKLDRNVTKAKTLTTQEIAWSLLLLLLLAIMKQLFKTINLLLDKPLTGFTVVGILMLLVGYFIYNNYRCLNKDYILGKAVITANSYDGAGNSAFDYIYVVSKNTYEGFSLKNALYDISIGDTVIIRYCPTKINSSRIQYIDKGMENYKINK